MIRRWPAARSLRPAVLAAALGLGCSLGLPLGPGPARAAAQAAAGRELVVGRGGAYADLAAALAASRDSDRILVRGGLHRGPLVVERAVSLRGEGWPVVDGGGKGTVIRFLRPGARMEGFVIRRSGILLEKEDAGIAAEGQVALVGNRLEDVLLGIDLQTAPESLVEGNEIQGLDLDMARRGDAMRLWESHRSVVRGNRVRRGRDLVIWYSQEVQVADNEVEDSRYGLHFMYAGGSRVTGNRLRRNLVAAYAMYSSDLHYQGNLLQGSHGSSGYGLALKDSDRITVEGNLIAGNRVGLYFDNSPAEAGAYNQVRDNLIAFNDIGAAFLPAVKHNRVGGNSFVDNAQQVALVTSGTFKDNDWNPDGLGNHWSNYVGFDADGDGIGDLSHVEIGLFASLLERHPELRLFALSPAQDAMDLAARAFPVFQPPPTLEDRSPRVRPFPAPFSLAPADPRPLALLGAALLLPALGVARWGLTLGGTARPSARPTPRARA